jgi:hypothetical protein
VAFPPGQEGVARLGVVPEAVELVGAAFAGLAAPAAFADDGGGAGGLVVVDLGVVVVGGVDADVEGDGHGLLLVSRRRGG